MRCLGIDPGTAICGCSIVDMQGMQMTPVWYDAIFTTPDQKAEDRLLQIYNDMNDILDHFHPDVMSIEKLFFNRNVNTAIPVAQARGVVLLAAAQRQLPILEFTPGQVKQAVAGTGSATKDQVTYMVMQILKIKQKPKPDDVADALAMAICGLHSAYSLGWLRGAKPQ